MDYEKQKKVRESLLRSGSYLKQDDLIRLIYTGRVTAEKSLDIVIKAVAVLREKGKSVSLKIVGGGKDLQQLQELTKVLKVEDCICFVGPCYDESELGRLFLSSDICVVPSAAGLSVMHAMAFGLPVITDNNFSRHGPEVEAVDEEVTGGFYQAGSLESLSDKVIEWGDKVQSDRDGVIKRSCIEKVEKSYTAERQVQLICAALNYGDEK